MPLLVHKSKAVRAVKTEQAFEAAIAVDGGNRWRGLLRKHMEALDDAYRTDDGGPRTHLGFSGIGSDCKRELWLKYRWAAFAKFMPRMLRLFNRGHLEEGRILALLELIGAHIEAAPDGKQHRLSLYGGHMGSALDALLYGVPDVPDQWCLGEFKTHNTKQFSKVILDGVQKAKPAHYRQMQACMAVRGVYLCLYIAVNKNDDDLYCEIVSYDGTTGPERLDLGREIIKSRVAPPRISNDPSNFQCTYCDVKDRCQFPGGDAAGPLPINCRTCIHSRADIHDGKWYCELHTHTLTKQDQLTACGQHEPIPDLLRR